MIVPNKIKIIADDNELIYVDSKKGIHRYQYLKSKTKKGEYLELSENDLIKLLNNNTPNEEFNY